MRSGKTKHIGNQPVAGNRRLSETARIGNRRGHIGNRAHTYQKHNSRVSETGAYRKQPRIGNGAVSETEWGISETAGTRIGNPFCAYQKPPRVGNQPLSETRLDISHPDATLLEFRPSCRHAHQNLSLRVTKKKRDTNAHRILALLHPT